MEEYQEITGAIWGHHITFGFKQKQQTCAEEGTLRSSSCWRWLEIVSQRKQHRPCKQDEIHEVGSGPLDCSHLRVED